MKFENASEKKIHENPKTFLILYGRATQLANRGPNPDLLNVETEHQIPG